MTVYGVSNRYAPLLPEACEILRENADVEEADGDGVLLLADGAIYRGTLFGARGIGEGELVFTTGMTGYQESLTDPSFAGQVLTFTYPMIGNYGIHNNRSESGGVWARGVVVRSAMKQPDHRDSIASVGRFLAAFGVPGLENWEQYYVSLAQPRMKPHYGKDWQSCVLLN
jgi:carbamoyl-phosphate synthase small subunit